jgi:RNase P subunit RPR2
MDRKNAASVLEAFDLVSTLFSSMAAMIDKSRIRMDQKHEKRMKTITKQTKVKAPKKTKVKAPKRCGTGYNLFVSTNVKKMESLQVAKCVYCWN